MRWLLLQAAVSTLRLRDPRTVARREWAMGDKMPSHARREGLKPPEPRTT